LLAKIFAVHPLAFTLAFDVQPLLRPIVAAEVLQVNPHSSPAEPNGTTDVAQSPPSQSALALPATDTLRT
jgi:hypothetical protein